MMLVVGASGQLGGLIVRGAIARGVPVRALVRHPEDAERLAAIGAEPVFGDLKDPPSLVEACRGIGTVVSTATAARRGGADSIESVDRQGNRALFAAARTAGVEHVVFTSVYGSMPDHPVPLLAAKAEAALALRDSGLAWTILAPDAFMEVWLGLVVAGPALTGGEVVYVGPAQRRHSFVSVHDVAAFAIAAAEQPAARGRVIEIGGPEALTWPAILATFERVLDQPIRQRVVAPGEPIPGMPDPIVAMLAGMAAHDSIVDSSAVARELGVSLTPLESYVRGIATTPPAAIG